MRSVPILKCSSEGCVCAPQSLSAGTLTSPRLSVSVRNADMATPPDSSLVLFRKRLERYGPGSGYFFIRGSRLKRLPHRRPKPPFGNANSETHSGYSKLAED